MFRKGIVTFFDDRLGLGHIELVADHQQITFKLENFSNTALLPQIGERVKCIVVEEHGEFLAKFIVRLDHKNYVADKKKPLASQYAYDENSFENVRNSRKILKKRRISADHIAHENEHSSENTPIDQVNVAPAKDETQLNSIKNIFATQSTKTVQFQHVAIQPQIIKSSSYTEAFVEAIKPIQIKESQPIVDKQIVEPVEIVQQVETTEAIQQIQVEQVQPVVDEVVVVDTQQSIVAEKIVEPVEIIQEVETTEAIQQIQVEQVQPVVDEVVVVDTQQAIVAEKIVEPVETVQEVETIEAIQQIQIEQVQSVVDEVVIIDTQQAIVAEKIVEPVETVQEVETTEAIQKIQVEQVQPVVDEIVIVDTQQPVVAEKIIEPVEIIQQVETTEAIQQIQVEQIVEPVQKVELAEPLQSALNIEKPTEHIPIVVQAVDTTPVADAFPPVKAKAEPNANAIERQKQLLERQLLEKNMNLTASQKFIQKMKVKFLYSKRKQTQTKSDVKKQFNFNPWILVTGVVLLGVINLGFYARDQYTEYKNDSLLKLQQYEQAQKEEIKRQKKEATSR
ncbi:hypothetical protein [Acinetobacter rongchengensis]|uniref:Uncharacterized protein n=1 Tax=Acinetobacter rongchengensis TaxID=2419601 RepID=A0A3A8ETL2_9GAMM|nr:hypothetical protein [Acinetobacter rongchengensis]RKG38187.1 hypothetical protein D7V20_08730 [Acinetobacter rongchengensis]